MFKLRTFLMVVFLLALANQFSPSADAAAIVCTATLQLINSHVGVVRADSTGEQQDCLLAKAVSLSIISSYELRDLGPADTFSIFVQKQEATIPPSGFCTRAENVLIPGRPIAALNAVTVAVGQAWLGCGL